MEGRPSQDLLDQCLVAGAIQADYEGLQTLTSFLFLNFTFSYNVLKQAKHM